MGIMNLIFPFFGGMSLCHGAGGLAGQYYFGARTGGTNIIERVIEISLGLFLTSSVADMLSNLPKISGGKKTLFLWALLLSYHSLLIWLTVS